MNDITMRPAYLGALPDQGFDDHANFAQPPRISMDNDRFNVIDENGDPVLPAALDLEVIMLWENDTRIYWGGAGYQPSNNAPPECFSDNKITPSDQAMQQQSDLCVTCPRAVRDQPGYMGKGLVSACKEHYKVACLVAGTKGKVFLLSVTPGSRKAYVTYLQYLRAHNAKANEVITKLTYADKAFQFSRGDWITESVSKVVLRIYETDEPAMIVNAFDKPRAMALPQPNASDDKFRKEVDEYIARPTPDFATPKSPEDLPTRPATVVDPPKRGRGRPPKEAPVSSAAPPTPPPSAYVHQSNPIPNPSFAKEMLSRTPEGRQLDASAPKDEYGFPSGSQNSPRTGVVPPAPKNNGGGFGMETEPQRPDAAMQAALDKAFGA